MQLWEILAHLIVSLLVKVLTQLRKGCGAPLTLYTDVEVLELIILQISSLYIIIDQKLIENSLYKNNKYIL